MATVGVCGLTLRWHGTILLASQAWNGAFMAKYTRFCGEVARGLQIRASSVIVRIAGQLISHYRSSLKLIHRLLTELLGGKPKILRTGSCEVIQRACAYALRTLSGVMFLCITKIII